MRRGARLAGHDLEAQGGKLFFTGEAGRRYLAISRAGYRRPDRIEVLSLLPDLKQAKDGPDYIAIGPADLLQPLQPLLDWRTGQGLKVVAVPLEAVYDQFGYGLPEPEAIRLFLQYAARAWQPIPRYVLLVGDATYDPRGYQASPEANRLPALMLQTGFGGETASDVLFTLLDEDGLPDLALGRIPARTPGQVRAFVKKTLSYEQHSTPGDWQKRILAIADGQEAGFAQDAQRFLDEFPEGYERLLYSPPSGVRDAPQQTGAYLDQGALFAFYFGHGSPILWGKDRLFSVDDVAGLQNGSRLPIVVTMTCLTGLFTHPKDESITERLLWQEDGGAAALLAPTRW